MPGTGNTKINNNPRPYNLWGGRTLKELAIIEKCYITGMNKLLWENRRGSH